MILRLMLSDEFQQQNPEFATGTLSLLSLLRHRVFVLDKTNYSTSAVLSRCLLSFWISSAVMPTFFSSFVFVVFLDTQSANVRSMS
jgi:hypothetical protein